MAHFLLSTSSECLLYVFACHYHVRSKCFFSAPSLLSVPIIATISSLITGQVLPFLLIKRCLLIISCDPLPSLDGDLTHWNRLASTLRP